MLSRRFLIIAGVIAIVCASAVFLIVTSRRTVYPVRGGAAGILIVAPLQDVCVSSVRFVKQVWRHYFFLITTAKTNDSLKSEIERLAAENNQCKEVELANHRLRLLLDFRKEFEIRAFAAEVIARDPSGWFKTILIDKGSVDGVRKRMPVVVSAGVVGQVVDVSLYYSKVLLVIDKNSAVDGLCQRTRARGIIQGVAENDKCDFIYVSRTSDVSVGDTVISSGLDGLYPKGLPLGRVSGVIKKGFGMFQTVEVEPYVNFDKLEEVMVVLNQPQYDFTGTQ